MSDVRDNLRNVKTKIEDGILVIETPLDEQPFAIAVRYQLKNDPPDHAYLAVYLPPK